MGVENGSFLDESWSNTEDLIGNRRFDWVFFLILVDQSYVHFLLS